MNSNYEIIIIGGGMVGLSLAYQLVQRGFSKKIAIIEKENQLGLHSSGRNSGVIHAGLYYKPDSVKAKVCVPGGKRLKKWIEERSLPLNQCGKVIIPQKENLDPQLDLLAERGKANGAEVEFWDSIQLKEFIPDARSSTGRALWSPNTSVVKPLTVLKELKKELKEYGVDFYFKRNILNSNIGEDYIKFDDGKKINFSYLYNCAGLYADKIAHKFNIGLNYSLLPFKGIYWKLKSTSEIKIPSNLYPVPDLNMPFLGVHLTPTADKDPIINIGPTATIALGRENYRGFNGINFLNSFKNLKLLTEQYLFNRNNFQNYVHNQAFQFLIPNLMNSLKELVPKIKLNDIELSEKVGIRSQLFNRKENILEDDFLCINAKKSSHILNAISPAFTASFALADYIIDQTKHNFKK